MTQRPLFVYGTLCDADLLAALLGRDLPDHQRVASQATGFRAVHFPQRVYPALLAAPGASAPGLLLHGLAPHELDILDAFEGDEYRHAVVPVQTPDGVVEADAYLPVVAIPPDAEPWTLANWTTMHKPAILAGELATASALRARLSARRDKP